MRGERREVARRPQRVGRQLEEAEAVERLGPDPVALEDARGLWPKSLKALSTTFSLGSRSILGARLGALCPKQLPQRAGKASAAIRPLTPAPVIQTVWWEGVILQ